MKFYRSTYPNNRPPSDATYPCALLVYNNWDDFTYRTSWPLFLYRSPGEKILDGLVKILQRDPTNQSEALHDTILPNEFSRLDESYCSLGQDLDFYKALHDAGAEIYVPFFESLRDAAYFPAIGASFLEVKGFRESLLRFSEAEKAFREAISLFNASVVDQSFLFSFRCKVPGAEKPHIVEFDFSTHRTGLHRTAVIIGRNGTGKTQFLAQFARAMSGWRSSSDPEHGFLPRRPSFSRVIAVSYSVFDDFIRPSETSRTFSYKYCGIREPNTDADGAPEGEAPPPSADVGARFLSPEKLKYKLRNARDLLRTLEREGRWKDIIKILLEGTIELTEENLDDLSFYDRLSSGQRILVAIMTEIVAHIAEQSIILFDEPELHLHPEVFVALARAFDRLLHEFDSYAIIATHSALLLQETLSRQVRVFKRCGNFPIVAPLTVESFGENLTVITSQVFAVDGAQHNFRAHLDELMKGRTSEQVEALFPMGLPLQALAYLKALETSQD